MSKETNLTRLLPLISSNVRASDSGQCIIDRVVGVTSTSEMR